MQFRVTFLLALLLAGCAQSGDEAPAAGAGNEAHSNEVTMAAEAAARSAAITKSPDVRGEEVSYTSGETTLKGYLAYDANRTGPRPGVLVVHEWWGHNDYVRERANMLAKMGYTALAIDMYGDGKQAAHPEDAQKFMGEVMSNIDEAERRFVAGREFLAAQPSTDAGHIAAIGYCFGGAVVLHMARAGMDLDGVASFHGSLGTKTPARPGVITASILVEHGADDPFVPAEQVEAFKAEMAAANVPFELHAYPGAKHGFTSPGATALGEQFGLPLEYNAAADKQSWHELDEFLKRVFANP